MMICFFLRCLKLFPSELQNVSGVAAEGLADRKW